MRAFLVAMGLIGAMMVGVGCDRTSVPARDLLTEIERALPESIASWQALSPPVHYDPETLFTYINGHAEVYLAYSLRRCLAQRYEGEEGGIVVDVFEMATPADAYGVFTHDQDGEPFDIGQGALFRYGWLSFWQGPYFVSIFAEGESDEAADTVVALGRRVAAVIPEKGSRPVLVDRLPSPGLVDRSVRYLHHPDILATHLFISRDNVFRLGPEAAAALGRYDREGEGAHLLLVDYTLSEDAAEAMLDFGATFLREDGSPKLNPEGWFAARRPPGETTLRAFILRADSEELANALLDDLSSANGGEQP